jgi:hypothetical protein
MFTCWLMSFLNRSPHPQGATEGATKGQQNPPKQAETTSRPTQLFSGLSRYSNHRAHTPPHGRGKS